MRNVRLTLIATFAILSLVLTGCYKLTNISTVSYDGKLSGSFTFNIPIENAELNDSAQNVDSNVIVEGPLDVIGITYEDADASLANLDACQISTMKLEIPNTAYEDQFSFVIVSQPENLAKKLYATGWAYLGTDTENGKIFTVDVNVIPESRNATDCLEFASVGTGDIFITPSLSGSTFNFGSIQMPEIANLDVGIAALQLSNLPVEDRFIYTTMTNLFARGTYSLDNKELDWLPENEQCWDYLSLAKFNALNKREFSSGEFLQMVNNTERLHVTSTDKFLKITCNYSGIDLGYADRSVNEYPWQSESFNPMGFWYKADESLIWEYRFRDANRLNLELMRTQGYYTFHDLNKNDNLNSHDSKMYNYLKKLGISQSVAINGVVLDTNGDFNKAKNQISFEAAGTAYSGSDLWLIEDSIKPGADHLFALIGKSITFESGKNKIATSADKLKSIAKTLRKDSPSQIRLVGIYDGSITNENRAAANQALVEKRLDTLKKKLKNLRVSASVIYGFVVDDTPNSGDLKAKNKVVIQVVPVG